MTKREIIDWLDQFDDDTHFNIGPFDEDELLIWFEKDQEAFKVYKEIIASIADWHRPDWVSICEAVNFDDLSALEYIGYVKIHPVVKDNKLCYQIDPEEIEKNKKLYSGLFEDASGYWVHQVCHFEDDYSGQMLLPFGDNGTMLCVGYHC